MLNLLTRGTRVGHHEHMTTHTDAELGDAIRLAAWKPAAIRRAIEDHGHALPYHVVEGMHAEADAIDAAADEATLELAARRHPAA